MAPTSTALTTKVESGTPYQLDSAQTLKATQALLKHMVSSSKADPSAKPNLLSDDDTPEAAGPSQPIYLTITTKKHIISNKRLKPTKITLPHPLNTTAATTICLITCEPQRTYKDIVASPAFPSELRERITRVIDIKKLKIKYKQYEQQRQLRDAHGIFLADDRIVTLLPKVLGKTFYKASVTRPVPVDLQAARPRTEGKSGKREKEGAKVGEPKEVAKEVERAVGAALVHLSPSVSTSVRVGDAGMTAQMVVENVERVVEKVVTGIVPKGWRGVRALHLKGIETMALPIWLADELWVEDEDVVDERAVEANVGKKRKKVLGGEEGKKRKAVDEEAGSAKKVKLVEGNDDNLDQEIALRKEMLKKQKEKAAEDDEIDIPKPTKKVKKSKKVSKEV